MTENEVFEHIGDLAGDYKCFDEKISHQESLILCNLIEEVQQYRAIGTMEEVRMLKDYKELYDVYKLIGTIEEFRNLKYKKNVIPIATIEFSKEDMQKIVDEKVAQIELDIQEIRAKAIVNELAEEFGKDTNVTTKDDWIPCSERLPKIESNTSDTVLVCTIDGFQHMAFWCDDGKWRYCESGMIKNPMEWTVIIAWMPLPAPYKENENGKI